MAEARAPSGGIDCFWGAPRERKGFSDSWGMGAPIRGALQEAGGGLQGEKRAGHVPTSGVSGLGLPPSSPAPVHPAPSLSCF